MGPTSKRRGGASGVPVRTKGRVKEKHEDDRKNHVKKARSRSPLADFRKPLDPTLLARGMSSRHVGARGRLSILTPEEMERDLRHMEAYANACTAYAQQFFIFQNRALVKSGHFGPVTAPTLSTTEQFEYGRSRERSSQFAMPVRIDPEEEKRVALLRKRIATSEAQREILETEYMSLRAHYVHESHRVRRTRHAVDGQVKLLQQLVNQRGRVLALKRVRVAVARDILSCLEKRTQLLESKSGQSLLHTNESNNSDDDNLNDVLDVWNDIENQLRDAERACATLELNDDLAIVKSMDTNKIQKRSDDEAPKKKAKDGKRNRDDNGDEGLDDNIVPWDAQTMPRTPFGIPVYVSQLSLVPDRAAGFGCGGMFGSNESSMCWLESNLPKTFEGMKADTHEVMSLVDESHFLEQELQKERDMNKELQIDIVSRRKRNDEMCAMMTMLRSETEAVLNRHNILLDTPEAREAAQDLHTKSVEDRLQRGEEFVHDNGVVHEEVDTYSTDQHDMSQEDDEEIHDDDDQGSLTTTGFTTTPQEADGDSASGDPHDDDIDHDGDDEGDPEDDEDEILDHDEEPHPRKEGVLQEGGWKNAASES